MGNRVHTVLLALCVLGAVVHGISFIGCGPCDDDFIVYRYAAHLVAGDGLVFNLHQPVEGFTVPLWVFLIAGGLRLGLDPALLSQALGIAAAAAAVLAVGIAWRRRHPEGRWPLPALLLAASPVFAFHSAFGLGTTVLAALLAWWFVLADRPPTRGGDLAASLVLGAAGLLRAEAILFAIPFVAARPRARRPLALLALAPPAGWVAFRWLYFGALTPVTWKVKKLPLFDDLGYGLAYLGLGTLECGVGLLLLFALVRAVRITGKGERGSTEGAAVAGLVLSVLFVVFVGGDYLALSRHFVPLLPLLFLLGVAGGYGIPAGHRGAGVAAFILVFGALQWPQYQRPELRGRYRFQEERWIHIGRALGEVAPPGTRLALAPIGAIGYHSGLPVIDMLGLTNDALYRVPPDLTIDMKGHHRHSAEWVLGQQPDVVLLGNGVRLPPPDGQVVISAWERSLFQHPTFERTYVAREIDIPGSYPLLYFERRAWSGLPGARSVSSNR